MRINPDYDYRRELPDIAAAYGRLLAERRPDEYPRQAFTLCEEFAAWAKLATESVRVAAMIRDRRLPVPIFPDGRRELVDVHETRDAEPYGSAGEMRDDLRAGHFEVSTAHCEHPIWTPAENVAFRIVHDVIGHGVSGGGFDWAGEVAACGVHFPLISPSARPALFTECIGQTAYAIAEGEFGPQVVGFLRPASAFHPGTQARPIIAAVGP